MSEEDVANAMDKLETEGLTITTRGVRDRLGYGSLRDIQRYITAIKGKRAHAAAETADTATAVADAPPVPDTAAAIAQDEARIVAAAAHLEEARRHQTMLQQHHALALAVQPGLVAAMRMGIITREAEQWNVVSEVQKQLDLASQAVMMAEATLAAAQRALKAAVREQAAAAYGATEEGAAILREIDRLQHLYTDADARESNSLASYSHALGRERSRFQQGLESFLPTDAPAQPPPTPSAPTSGLTVESLRQYYLDGLGRSLPHGLTRLEESHYPLLCQVGAVLREQHSETNNEFMSYQRDDRLSSLAWHDPGKLPMRKVQERLVQLHMALELVKNDMRTLQQRASAAGRTL